MRILFFLMLLLVLSCHLLKKSNEDDFCNEKFKSKKALFETLFVTNEKNFVKSIDLDKILISDTFNQVVWKDKSGRNFRLKDSISFKLMLVQNELILTLDSLCLDRRVNSAEVKKLFGTPNEASIRYMFYYFNHEGTRECYNKDSWVGSYGNCGGLGFEFNEYNSLVSWNHTYLFALDLGRPIADLSLDYLY